MILKLCSTNRADEKDKSHSITKAFAEETDDRKSTISAGKDLTRVGTNADPIEVEHIRANYAENLPYLASLLAGPPEAG